jgi:hypothetical protein
VPTEAQRNHDTPKTLARKIIDIFFVGSGLRKALEQKKKDIQIRLVYIILF